MYTYGTINSRKVVMSNSKKNAHWWMTNKRRKKKKIVENGWTYIQTLSGFKLRIHTCVFWVINRWERSIQLTWIWLAANQTTGNIMVCHASMEPRSYRVIHWLFNSYDFQSNDQTCIFGPLWSAVHKLCLVIEICAVHTKHHIAAGPICRYFLQWAHSGVRRRICVVVFAYILLTSQ